MDLLVSRAVVDSHADLFLVGKAEPQRAGAAVGKGESTGVEFIKVRGDDFAEFGRVVDLRYEVNFDLGAGPA